MSTSPGSMYFHVHGNIWVIENTKKNCDLKDHRSSLLIKQTTTTTTKTTTTTNQNQKIQKQTQNKHNLPSPK